MNFFTGLKKEPDMDISKMTQKAKNDLLQHLVDKLDELDEQDYFGTEGWKHFFSVEE